MVCLCKRVILRADAGKNIGFGHFVRTNALAAILSKEFECYVASFNPDIFRMSDYQLALIAESGASPLPIEAQNQRDFDEKFLNALGENDVVVLDNYYFTTDYQRRVRSKCRALVAIDDMHQHHFVADALFTFCPLSRSDFSLEDYTQFYGGIHWSFLRAPFLKPLTARNAETPPRRVVISVGGADPLSLSDKIISAVRMASPDIHIDIMAGQTVEISTPESEKLNVWRQIDASQVASLFDNADLGIFPASTVCVEAFSRKLPVAAGWFVDNQEEFYNYGVKHGWFYPLGDLRDSASLISSRISALLNSRSLPASPNVDFAAQKEAILKIFANL